MDYGRFAEPNHIGALRFFVSDRAFAMEPGFFRQELTKFEKTLAAFTQ
jgi:hypothetical protein